MDVQTLCKGSLTYDQLSFTIKASMLRGSERYEQRSKAIPPATGIGGCSLRISSGRISSANAGLPGISMALSSCGRPYASPSSTGYGHMYATFGGWMNLNVGLLWSPWRSRSVAPQPLLSATGFSRTSDSPMSTGCSCGPSWPDFGYLEVCALAGDTNEEPSEGSARRARLVASRSRRTFGCFASNRKRHRDGQIRSQPPAGL